MDTIFLAIALFAFLALVVFWMALPATPEPSRVTVSRRMTAEA
jgi:hypothetical protein